MCRPSGTIVASDEGGDEQNLQPAEDGHGVTERKGGRSYLGRTSVDEIGAEEDGDDQREDRFEHIVFLTDRQARRIKRGDAKSATAERRQAKSDMAKVLVTSASSGTILPSPL